MKKNHPSHFPTPFSQNAFDIIDKTEFKTILEKNKKDCLFCKPTSPKKILLETSNFYVTFDDSPLLEGHLMIHTKIHYGCCGEIPEEQFEEFIHLKTQVKNIIENLYGVCSFYEHGRAGHCSISIDDTLCEHFHLHALPLADDISSDIELHHKEKAFLLSGIEKIPTYYEQYDQYLLYEGNDIIRFYPVVDKIPSHFLRTIIATKIGYPDRANWENETNLEFINSFKRKIKSKYE